MQLNIGKLGSIVAISSVSLVCHAGLGGNIVGSSAQESQINQDLKSLTAYHLEDQKPFRNNPWLIDFSNAGSIVLFLKERISFVFEENGVPALCYSDKSSRKDDLIVKGARVSSCSADTMSVNQKLPLDILADPNGYIGVVKGKEFLEGMELSGGYVVNPYQYIPFEQAEKGVFWSGGHDDPVELKSDESRLLFRVANYLGDSLLMEGSSITYCESVTSSYSFTCDSAALSTFTLKGVALMSFASSCESCTYEEQAFLAGTGIQYLLSTPRSSTYYSVALSAYHKLKGNLESAGFDTTGIDKRKIYGLIN